MRSPGDLDQRGREIFAGQVQETGEAVTVWRTYWLAGVTAAMRIREMVDGTPVAGEIWDIQFTQAVGPRGDGLEIACTRLGA